MVLSSDELEIVRYVESWNGAPITMVDICRCASGRKRFRETPHWARALMSRLVEAKLLDVNERGHYSAKIHRANPEKPGTFVPPLKPVKPTPSPEPRNTPQTLTKMGGWISPQMAELLKKSGKSFAV